LKAESEIKLNEAKVLAEIKLDENQWKAFSEAQKGATSSSWEPSDRSPVWLTCAYGIAEIFIKIVRPSMVVGAFVLIAHTYNTATEPAQIAELATAIQTFAFSVGYFWIGQRYQSKIGSSSVSKK
jgi:hypothetical protein